MKILNCGTRIVYNKATDSSIHIKTLFIYFKMTTLKLFIYSILLLTVTWSSVHANEFERYIGTWTNHNSEVPKISISIEGSHLMVRAWGKCDNSVCDWGQVIAEPFSQVIPTSNRGNSRAITATFRHSLGETKLILQNHGSRLSAQGISKLAVRGIADRFDYMYDLSASSTRSTYPSSNENKEVVTGTIFGEAFGDAKSTASIFQISLYGPDNTNRFITSINFDQDKTYAFEKLEDGVYWIAVESRGPSGVDAYPQAQRIKIENGVAIQVDVELR